MSSTPSAPPLELRLRPSRQLALFLLFSHGATLAVLTAVNLPPWAVAVLASAIIVSFVHYWRRYVLRRSPRAVVAVSWRAEGWQLTDGTGRVQDARLLPGSYLGEHLIVLRFSAPRRYVAVLLPDSAPAGELRELRARLRLLDPFR